MLRIFCHLLAKLNHFELHKDEAYRIDKLKDAFPSSYSSCVIVLTEMAISKPKSEMHRFCRNINEKRV